jgi:cell wall-associated NlpC family hydrolase
MTREAIRERAVSLVGTPFHHGARKRGIGVDCVGVLIVIASELGVLGPYQHRAYSRLVDTVRLKAELAKYFDPLGAGERLESGDVILFRVKGHPQHVGVYVGDGYFVHADEGAGGVVMTGLRGKWSASVEERYRWKGLPE